MLRLCLARTNNSRLRSRRCSSNISNKSASRSHTSIRWVWGMSAAHGHHVAMMLDPRKGLLLLDRDGKGGTLIV